MRALGVAIGHAGAPFADSIALAERAEAAGLGLVAIGDANVETIAAIGAVAARTSRIELVSSVATWTRTPITIAHAAKTLQNVAEGRYRLGLGPMPKRWSEE